MHKIKKKYRLSVIIILLPLFCVAQNKGCVDSVSFNKYYNQYFSDIATNPAPRDAADNLYINASTQIGGNGYASIVKFNTANQLLWYKNYITRQFFTEIAPYEITAIDTSANLFFSSFGQNSITLIYQSLLSKFDSAGNFIWGRRIERTDAPTVYSFLYNDNGGTVADDGSTFYQYLTIDDFTTANIVKVDAIGNINWSKKYGNTVLPQFRILDNIIVYQDGATIVLFSHFYYDAPSEIDINAKHGIQMIKINTADGSLVSQKTMMYYYDANGNLPNRITLKKINYDKNKKQFLIDSRGEFLLPYVQSHVLTILSDNTDIVKTNFFTSNGYNPDEDIRIGPDNSLTLTQRKLEGVFGNLPVISYATFNNNLELITQKKIQLATIGFPAAPFITNISYKKDGILNFQIGLSGGSSVGNPLFLFDHSPFYQGISNCLGYDTVLYTKRNIYTLPVNGITFNEFNGVPLQSTHVFYTDPILDLQMVKTELCKEVSICDTIKLFGTQYHCLSNPLDSFKIIRNPLCKRITNWQVDTNYIKILSQTDTTLFVQYLQPYRGSIKVGFGGCSLTDTIPIEVYAAKTGVNLGNDTMHCPGKTITLKAGKGFKNYVWQNGSIADSLIAALPGTYRITATDSCGNIFKDTLLINPFDVVLKTDYPQQLCPGDTATFILSNQLTNYSWLPATNSSLNNFTWRLYPAVTTTYSISGQRLPGCIISDTVLINVKLNCLPDYMYFPNAFTPNNDGLNDTYKPGLNGQLALYEFAIYNRYGQLVFKTTQAGKGWDGKFKNSPKPLGGSYVWSCKYQFVGKPVEQEQGTFMLIR